MRTSIHSPPSSAHYSVKDFVKGPNFPKDLTWPPFVCAQFVHKISVRCHLLVQITEFKHANPHGSQFAQEILHTDTAYILKTWSKFSPHIFFWSLSPTSSSVAAIGAMLILGKWPIPAQNPPQRFSAWLTTGSICSNLGTDIHLATCCLRRRESSSMGWRSACHGIGTASFCWHPVLPDRINCVLLPYVHIRVYGSPN